MSPLAAVANSTWIAASVPAWLRFRRALGRPEETQSKLLLRQLAGNCRCAYGQAYGFNGISSYAEFVRRVPLIGYDELAPWVKRIMRGEPAVLTSEPVTRLMPTSGTTGARKLIPFTAGLQRDFNAAIGPWMVDLAQQHPWAMGGPAYWSVTPIAREPENEASAVPIGFENDSEYLGGMRHRLVEAVMAAPSTLRHIGDIAVFRRLVLLFLLRNENLRLISVWHPSFLALLLDAMPPAWDSLLADIQHGGYVECDQLPSSVRSLVERLPPQPHRASQLRRVDPRRPETIWPKLQVVSCWGDGNARFALDDLSRRFPHVIIQPKGLLSTEAFVTVPFAGKYPAAVMSHFFEFIDEQGDVHPLSQLRAGDTYEIVVTTNGGLWRYRTCDQVEVTDFVGRTPSLRFIGRTGRVSDRFGEKLSEAFVALAIEEVFMEANERPRFVMLAPEERFPGKWSYTLYVEGVFPADAAKRLDARLRENPHYAYCRDLGQLQPLQIFNIGAAAYDAFVAAESENGARLGEIKPVSLSLRTNWSRCFSGTYAPGVNTPAELA